MIALFVLATPQPARPVLLPHESSGAAGKEPLAQPEIPFADLANGTVNRMRLMAAMNDCVWEPADSLVNLTQRYRESGGAWTSADSIYRPYAFFIDARGVPVYDLSFIPTEVCTVPTSKVTGWGGDGGDGVVEDHVVFTRTTSFTLPAGLSLLYKWVPATWPAEDGVNRFLGPRFDWLVHEDGELATYPPLHPHHVGAEGISYPAVDGLATFDPFICVTDQWNVSLETYARLTTGPVAQTFCDAPPDSPTGNREVCDEQFAVSSTPMLLPAGADYFGEGQIDNLDKENGVSGRFVAMREFFTARPPSRGGVAVQPKWDVQWRIADGIALHIPPAAGPSFAGHTYMNEVSMRSDLNTPHMHSEVQTEIWFIVGQSIDELVPPVFSSHIHPARYWGDDREGGYELTNTSISHAYEKSGSPDGDIWPVLLRGTAFEDNLEALKAFITSKLTHNSLKCVYHSNRVVQDGTFVNLPSTLDEDRTPSETCTSTHIGAKAPVSVFAFYGNSTLSRAYFQHSLIKSYVQFDEDPFLHY